MNGLIILNSHEEIRAVFGILGTFVVVFGGCAFACVFFYEHAKQRIISGCVALVLIACAVICFTVLPKETVVQAYMQDGVNMSEVTEKYEVRSVDGLLLTLVEKEG